MPGEGRAPKRGPEIRIAHVVGGMNRGGVETWLMHVLRSIDRKEFQMDFIVHSDTECAFDEEIRSLGSRLLRSSNPRRPWSYVTSLKRLLRQCGPFNVVHSHLHHFTGLVLRVASSSGVPARIAHSHNDTRPAESNRGMLRSGYLRLAQSWIENFATCGLAASREAAVSLFGQNWKADPRWKILYYGIDLDVFRAPADQLSTRAELGIPPDAFIVGHVGRFYKQKNHDFFLDVALEVSKRDPAAHFLFVGDGPLRSEIERKAAVLGLGRRALFTGVRSDAPRLMRAAMDVFLFPSFFEGLPVVLLEAQAAGLPAVISDAISTEADVVTPPLIHRLPLSAPTEIWSAAVLAARRSGSGITPQQALFQIENSPFDIRMSTEKLCAVYRDHGR